MHKIGLIALFSLLVSANTYADSPTLGEFFDGAQECSNEVVITSQPLREQNGGMITLKSVPFDEIDISQYDMATSQHSIIQLIPVAESTYLDGSSAGSAWRNCMASKGLPVPTGTQTN